MLVKIRNLEATIGNQLITLDNFSIRLTSAGMSFYNLLTKVSVNETSIKNWG
jgi:DNA-binding transcriptional LysR family regulator